MSERKRWAVRAAIVFAAVVIGTPLLILSGQANASGPGPNTRVPVTGGVRSQTAPGATPTGPTTPYNAQALSFILKPHDSSQLFATAEDGTETNYLSVQQFAADYGATARYVNELEQYLSGYGISDFTLYADGLDLKAVGTTTEVEKAFSVQEENYESRGVPGKHGMQGIRPQHFYAPRGRPMMPQRLAQTIVAILGLTSYAPWVDQVARSTAQPEHRSTTSCEQLTGLPDACHTPTEFTAQYQLTGLTREGDEGQGQTIGIVTLAALNQTAPGHFWDTVLHLPKTGRTVRVITIDGGPGAPSTTAGTGETDLDVEQSGGIARAADVDVYQAPNTTAGFADGFYTAASQNVAGSVSCSWGESEAVVLAFGAAGLESPGYQEAFDEAFAEMAIQGQSLFIASGDAGAYAPSRTTGGEWKTLGVGSPADSAYATAAGGTTLAWTGTASIELGTTTLSGRVDVTAQRAWGWDYLAHAFSAADHIPYATLATAFVVGSTGGYSRLESMPSYQQGVSGTQSFSDVGYFTSTKSETDATTPFGAYYGLKGYTVATTWSVTASPRVSRGSGSGRAVPDVSADADPFTGYLLYNPSANTGTALQGGWGGTSFVAPQLNGSDAVIESAVGHRVGFWNPAVYSFATGRNSPFTPLDQSGTTNDNIYYTGTPGTVYNPATGLGTPDLTELARDFSGEGSRGS
ncbi:MAG TPA: S53 family peptidase [Acidimicrobiales bacterium]|nr:S53 family peptidase [Acidimicrobiales bacterium]